MTRDREVRDATDPFYLVSQYVRLKRQGKVAVGRCPFHNEKTASFRVNLAGHRFAGRTKCFGCDWRGDVIDFVARIEGISHFEALKTLAADAGIDLTRTESVPEVKARREDRKHADLWYRDRWKFWRRSLNAALMYGPPEYPSDTYSWAEFCGQMMCLIQRLQGTEEGLRAWRVRRVIVPRISGAERFNSLMDRLLYAYIARLAVEALRRQDEMRRVICPDGAMPEWVVKEIAAERGMQYEIPCTSV